MYIQHTQRVQPEYLRTVWCCYNSMDTTKAKETAMQHALATASPVTAETASAAALMAGRAVKSAALVDAQLASASVEEEALAAIREMERSTNTFTPKTWFAKQVREVVQTLDKARREPITMDSGALSALHEAGDTVVENTVYKLLNLHQD